MNIYFSCSITGGRNEEEVYQALVKEMLALGHQVPTAHLSKSNVLEVEKIAKPEEIFARDIRWLRNCDAVVAEVTSPSHGVGYEIAVALMLEKPVLCCFKKDRKVSMILTGNSSANLSLYPYESADQAVAGLREFIDQLTDRRLVNIL